MSTGTCTIHTWNDSDQNDEVEPGIGARVDEQLRHNEDLYESSRLGNGRTSLFRTRLRSGRVNAAREQDIDEEA